MSTSPSTSHGLSESDILALVEAADNKITKLALGGLAYYGQMEEGNCNGYGTFTWASGQKYTGKWKNDKKDGTGILTDANGNKYVGEWKNDKRNGQGTFTFASGNIDHSGEWVNDEPKK